VKKYFLSIVFIMIGLLVQAQIINIPDANFKAKLLEASPSNTIAKNTQYQYFKIDSNDDGEIQLSEALEVYGLYLNNANIESLEGIFSFSNLGILEANNNSIQEFVLPNDMAFFDLVVVDLSYNELTQFDLNVMWEEIYGLNLSFNNLTNLDFSNISFIDGPILLNNNQLESIVFPPANWQTGYSISVQPDGYFNIRNNNLNGIDFSGLYFPNDGGSVLYYGNNISDTVIPGENMRSFYYSGNAEYFDARFVVCNTFLTLDAPNLKWINSRNNNLMNYCFQDDINYDDDKYDYLDPMEDWSHGSIHFINCPNLEYICADEGEIEYLYQSLQNSNIPEGQAHINTYCNFNNPTSWCRIWGKVRLSMDTSCDEDDDVFPGLQFNIVSGDDLDGIAVSNHQGDFFIPLKCIPGNFNYTITPVTEQLNYYSINPSLLELHFPGSPFQTYQNFCLTPNGIHPDAEIIVSPLNDAVPGFSATYKIVTRNKGTTVLEGSSLLTYPATLMTYQESNVAPTSSTSGLLSWNYTNLQPFETRTITVSFLLNTPMDTPALNGGDILALQGQVTTLATDVSPSDNSFILQQTVVNSYDPNDKTCLQGNVVSETLIGEFVHYLIRFENTGTFFAQNVVISDYIDLDSFELNSLIVLDASHTQWTRIIGNKVEFIFENIQLPYPPSEERHGYVLFKIKLKNNLSVGDSFSNTASIFFDFNFPIVTEEAVTQIEALGVSDFEFSNYIQLYPVPTKDYMHFKSNSLLVNKISIYNTQGQLAMVFMTPNPEQPLEVSPLSAGTYFVRFETDQGVSTGKIIKL